MTLTDEKEGAYSIVLVPAYQEIPFFPKIEQRNQLGCWGLRTVVRDSFLSEHKLAIDDVVKLVANFCALNGKIRSRRFDLSFDEPNIGHWIIWVGGPLLRRVEIDQ